MKTLSTLAMLFVTSAAHANGCWDCEPEPPKEPPVVVEPPAVTPQTPGGGSIYDPAGEIFYGTCFCNGEYTVSKMPSLRSPEFRAQAAKAQCQMLNVKRRCAVTDDAYVGDLK